MDDWVEVKAEVESLASGDAFVDSSKPTRAVATDVALYHAIQQGALKRLESSSSPIFHADLCGEALYTTFLKNLPESLNRVWCCSTCRRFTEQYGNLALINDDGTLQPLLWCLSDLTHDTELASTFGPAFAAMTERFHSSKVTKELKLGVNRHLIGKKEKGGFHHLHLDLSATGKNYTGLSSTSTAEAAAMLDRILAKYTLSTVEKTYTTLVERTLPYADNHKASCKWLLDLMQDTKIATVGTGTCERHNLLFRYAASAFTGALHQLNSGALSTLLVGIQSGYNWGHISREWSAICDPVNYMRPKAAPSAGNIAAAERVFEQLGITKQDLRRRLLIQDDVPEEVIMWSSETMKKPQKPTRSTIFGAVTPKRGRKLFGYVERKPEASAAAITFTDFVKTVLPFVKEVECWLNPTDVITTFVTGLEGSKPLMQWHDQAGKNLASAYVWTHRPRVEQHNLRALDWNEVRCLIPAPWLWDGVPETVTFPLADPDDKANAAKYKYYHKQKGFRYVFVFEEGHETKLGGLPLFPEYLKTEFHGVRSTIEAFCQTENMEDVDGGAERGGFVSGIELGRDKTSQNLKFRVRSFDGILKQYNVKGFD